MISFIRNDYAEVAIVLGPTLGDYRGSILAFYDVGYRMVRFKYLPGNPGYDPSDPASRVNDDESSIYSDELKYLASAIRCIVPGARIKMAGIG